MAVIKFGGGIADARGSLGGTVFSRTRAGAIMRNRTKPVDPTTPAQSTRRNQFANIVSGFRNLSVAEIESWTTFSQSLSRNNALGDSYIPQPSQIYQESNMNLALVGAAAVTTAPINKPDPPTIGETVVGGTNTAGLLTMLALNPSDPVNADYIIVEATLPMSASRQNVKKYFRQIFAGAYADPLVLTSAYKATFTGGGDVPVEEGQVITFRFRVIYADNGFSSDWYVIRFPIPAAA